MSSTGRLSGTPTTGTTGTYPLTLKATNGVTPPATHSFTLTVDQAPAITPPATTPPANGYYEVASDGGVFAFGNATFHGSMGGKHLNAPVVGMARDTATGGYWEVAADGGIFTFGTAQFDGSESGKSLTAPIAGMAMG